MTRNFVLNVTFGLTCLYLAAMSLMRPDGTEPRVIGESLIPISIGIAVLLVSLNTFVFVKVAEENGRRLAESGDRSGWDPVKAKIGPNSLPGLMYVPTALCCFMFMVLGGKFAFETMAGHGSAYIALVSCMSVIFLFRRWMAVEAFQAGYENSLYGQNS